jgi:putative flippase GtrA
MPGPSEGLRLQRATLASLVGLCLQYGRFALVGLGATAVHVAVYAGTIELLALQPLAANTLGFAAGVNVSFIGHWRWTFAGESRVDVPRSLVRFWLLALAGFALNTAFVQLVTGTLELHYGWSIPLIVGVTPFVTFTLSKLWAFRA